MVTFPITRTRHLTFQLKELTIAEAAALAGMNAGEEQAECTAFLRAALKEVAQGEQNPADWTVEERILAVCQYLAGTDADGTPGALAGKTVRVILLTGGTESWYESDGIGEALDNQIRRQTLMKYCGVEDAELVYVDGLSMGDDDPAKREAAARHLDRIRQLGASLA